MSIPIVSRDPRFRAGRTLLQRGQCEQATSIFATLLEEARTKFGHDSIETAPAYYEYGNALFRTHQQQLQIQEEQRAEQTIKEDKLNAREAAAAAAELRLKGETAQNNTKEEDVQPLKIESEDLPVNEAQSDNENDAELALEMMENAWSILDKYSEKPLPDDYSTWLTEQSPRVLVGIGDVLSCLERHADAADVYLRALALRQTAVSEAKCAAAESIELLRYRRLVVEANILVAEELLACPEEEDVVTTETKVTLVSASEKVEYARGYYENAREELQETVLLMGALAAKGFDVSEEKEDICNVSVMVMGVGITFAQMDEQRSTAAEESPKKKLRKS
jgi:tetratricopeptide (TPR) repeat protein